MGEYADLMLEGDCCSTCGEYLGDGDGYPRQCGPCEDEAPVFNPKAPPPPAKPTGLFGFWLKIAMAVSEGLETDEAIAESLNAGGWKTTVADVAKAVRTMTQVGFLHRPQPSALRLTKRGHREVRAAL